MRYKPEDNRLYIDSKTPEFEKYHEFLEREVRYRSLSIKNKEMAATLLEENRQAAIKRYEFYESFVKKED